MKRLSISLFIVATCIALASAAGKNIETTSVFKFYKGENCISYKIDTSNDDPTDVVVDEENLTHYQVNQWRLFWPETVNGKNSTRLHITLADALSPTNKFHPTNDKGALKVMGDYIIEENPIHIKSGAVLPGNMEDMPFGTVGSSRTTLDLKGSGDLLYVFEIFHDIYYPGAAHGMQVNSYVTYDPNNDKVVKLTDIVTDTTALRTVATKHLFERYEVSNMAELIETTGYFLEGEDYLPLPHQFYFYNGDLHLVYQPYEIAAYVFGIIDIDVPSYLLSQNGILSKYAESLMDPDY
ncbi:MAG: DUF3298 domain-containing protein [Muribaculaceae bacterium]|nr:DUF3298 domain-containing protein [Muribaculaceae bacterium]